MSEALRQRRVFAGGAAAALTAAVVAVLLLAGGGGSGDGDPGAARPGGESSPAKPEESPAEAGTRAGPNPQRAALTRSQLIARADRICERSQSRYLEVRDLAREFSSDAAYARALVRIAEPRIRGLRELTAPPQLADPYGEYVRSQERVLRTDKQAVTAAREGDDAGVETARAERDSEDELRERLAREIGFRVCSTPKG